MQQLSKIVTRQDANFKLSPSASNETSINLSKEISALISDESGDATFTLYKSDFIKALSALCLIPKIYLKKEQQPSNLWNIFRDLSQQIEVQFGDAETSQYTINHFKREDGRAYFNNLKSANGFNLRAFLVEQFAVLTFERTEDGKLSIRLNIDAPKQKETPHINIVEEEPIIDEPLQQILFGAPGTGKSHTINSDANITEQNSIRTTFHPDSDYSTFVGCYKPTKKEQSKGVLTPLNDLISISKEQSTTEQRVKFISKYAESIKAAAKENGLSDNRIIRDTNYFGWNSDTYLMNFLNEILEERAKIDDSEITYDFTPQAFTNAYVAAWKNVESPFFLIIEEINRGNCAQIFGDIFQLLDRDEYGYSSYKTTPDQDLANYIREQFTDTDIDDADVKSGKKMQLPPNLYIWATMNTSDQSLFPIDSAFKRRWDWRYIPIDYTDRGHFIACGDTQYSWADFLQKVNDRVESVTQSEDKKLGYWFMGNGAEQKEITIDRFVSKVIFYLWNDVFKDFGKSGNTIFKDSFAKFHLFFDFSGKPKVDVVKAFLDALEVKSGEIEAVNPENGTSSNGIDYTKYTFDGQTKLSKKALGERIVMKYLEQNSNLSFDQMKNVFVFDDSVVSKEQYKGIIAKSEDITGSYVPCYGSEQTSSDGIKFKVLTWWNKYNIDFIIKFAEAQSWSVTETSK